eukprot:7295443-Alexandrium_andersonii.AAC.1
MPPPDLSSAGDMSTPPPRPEPSPSGASSGRSAGISILRGDPRDAALAREERAARRVEAHAARPVEDAVGTGVASDAVMSFCEENAVQPRTGELYRKYFDSLTTYLSETDMRPGPWTEEVLSKDQ